MLSSSRTKLIHLLPLLTLVISGIAVAQPAEPAKEATSLQEAFTYGTPTLNFRYRYEFVQDEAIQDSAHASTLRSRLGFKTASFHNLTALLEVEDVSPIGNDLYNSTTNGKTERAVVADPNSTEVNQAALMFSGVPDTKLTAGRHRLVLDNHRFVGDVGWRQNDQTHDGLLLSNTSLKDTELLYAYTTNVNRIFSDKSTVGDFDSNLNIFHFSHSGLPVGKLVSYVYLFEIKDAPTLSSASYGASLDGSVAMSEAISVLYDIEYALQQDYENNPADYTAHYWRAATGVTRAPFTLKAGFESLGSDDGLVSFSTPFATLHRWNGWADKFLTTPIDGLRDGYAELRYSVKDVESVFNETDVTAAFHHFSSDNNSTTYGTEWDFDVTKKLYGSYTVGAKYAFYNAKSLSQDTQKLIFSIGANFGS